MNSLNLINSNINLLKKCNLYLDDNNIESLKNFIFLFYKNLYDADIYYNYNFNKIKKIVKENVIFQNKKNKFMGNSKFFPENIKNFIENQKTIEITYIFKIHSRSFSLYFYFYNNDKDIENVDLYSKIVYIWLYIANNYIQKECSKNTNFYIFMTPYKKKLPVNKNDILDENNVNTAFTNGGCNINGEIIIYRKEEWFKVLIHECFHSFDFDFCTNDIEKAKFKLKKYFNIKSDIQIYESYCEVWARIINCLITAYFILENRNNIEYYFELTNVFLQFERIYSLKQCNLILDFMGLKYSDLFDKNQNNYKEKSNVFCYYIVGAILMNNYLSFIEWCYKNNKYFLNFSPKKNNINLYTNYIIKMAINIKFLNDLKCIKLNDKSLKNNNSSRMTIIEI